jgi:hypothetical protein
MRSTLCAVALFLALVCLGAQGSFATSDRAANITGGGTFVVGNDLKGHFNFNAVTHQDGSVTGHLSLRNPEAAPDQDVDGTGDPSLEGLPDGVELTADLDSMNISGNRAALSGVVRTASNQRYVGLRIVLTVEDTGEGDGDPDKITWGFYQRVIPRLVADFENPEAGAYPVGVKTLASDAENPEAGAFLVGESDIDSNSFPLSSYALNDINGGNIQVHD